ncbi:MAG TPA: U32 family peptidase [Anaerohalosphaeraceae bacterium]|nr:U32 family peptidase [Phycisphaerae bacterium]HOK94894.1 U32 family peptidase [Anaerohalosphaeraceae bacterium]HOL30920.1 U32 family peptidase [Anaerohalosphaeraceae bacterium]HOM75665.1 U32 family peptidase [Anaerohalosphaeraceae bacterium]HPC64419.1 U32 family peptidase [Anaerohalosphaeraceae bacterium]
MTINKQKPELLAPAGTLEKLKFACAYGADAVYFGMEFGSLRSFAGNFTLKDAKDGLDYLHARGKKGYITLNIYPFSEEYDKLIRLAKQLDSIGADAFIISDVGVLAELKKLHLHAAVHISTQANTTSWQAALAYKELGAKRINLARELSLEQIQEIQLHLAGQVDTEVFIHGAVCFSYSGRCAISDYLAGARANRGECKHPCRWKYYLVEEKRPGQFLPVFEDNRGLYLFNSKELALWEYVPALAAAGIGSFKIEGRMKSIHYLSSVVSFYRQVIDGKTFTQEEGLQLLNRIPNRGYSAGFIRGAIMPEDYSVDKSISEGTSVFVGNVIHSAADGCTIEVRNTIRSGDTLEVLTPDGQLSEITLSVPLKTVAGEYRDIATNGQFIQLPVFLPEFSILRRLGDIKLQKSS